LPPEIAAAVTRIAGVPAERVLVVFESSPARFAVEGGRTRRQNVDAKTDTAGVRAGF
jgi:hypothetical protein